jgi:hypothetical protein
MTYRVKVTYLFFHIMRAPAVNNVIAFVVTWGTGCNNTNTIVSIYDDSKVKFMNKKNVVN